LRRTAGDLDAMNPQLILGMMALNRKLVWWAADDSRDPWSLGNQVLYDLCASHPEHRDDRVILAKVWLIGRAYSAAVERRRTLRDTATMGDRFYTKVVAPGIAASGIDDWLNGLPPHSDRVGAADPRQAR